MKAQDLRIGNLVNQLYTFGCDGTKKPEWRIWELDLIDIQDVQSRPEIYRPIPLTEEWFPKMGFTSLGKNYWLGNFCFNAEQNTLLWFGIMLHNSLWDEVHKFQNLHYSLTGNEIQFTL